MSISKSLRLATLLATAGTLFVSGTPLDYNPTIVGGEIVEENQYPYYVQIEAAGSLCGGTLIAPDMVLYAAHCGNGTGGDFKVGAYNRHDESGNATMRSCTDYRAHPDYVSPEDAQPDFSDFLDWDFSLCKLNQPVFVNETQARLELNWDHSVPTQGDEVVAIGMGRIWWQGALPDYTRHVQIPVYDCSIHVFDLPELRVCAAEPGQGICSGDSGGPLVKIDGNVHTLIGVSSATIDCESGDWPGGIFARTSVGLDWIQETTCSLGSIASFCSSEVPSQAPSPVPSQAPSKVPSQSPSAIPSSSPTIDMSESPTATLSQTPTSQNSESPTATLSESPTAETPTSQSSESPTAVLSESPTAVLSQTPTSQASQSPTVSLSESPTAASSESPTSQESQSPTAVSSESPTETPSNSPSNKPTVPPSPAPQAPLQCRNRCNRNSSPWSTKCTWRGCLGCDACRALTNAPTASPTVSPTGTPTGTPTNAPTNSPSTGTPTKSPTGAPTNSPTVSPTASPTGSPTGVPTNSPTGTPTASPTGAPTFSPTNAPSTASPTGSPTGAPTNSPTGTPTASPTGTPTNSPTNAPSTATPTESPTGAPSNSPTATSTANPTKSPSSSPTIGFDPVTDPPTATPTANPIEAPCRDRCLRNRRPWSTKCTWRSCSGCPACL